VAKVPTNLKTPLRDGDIDRPDDPAYERVLFYQRQFKERTSSSGMGRFKPFLIEVKSTQAVMGK